jgi:beta-phosphoglucomutase
MDGTMINNTPYHLKSWQGMFKKYGLGELAPQTYYTEISGVPIMKTLQRLFPGENETRLNELFKEKEGIYKELYGPFVVEVNGLENLLIELKNAGVKLAMASSASVDDIDFILSHVPVREYFEVIIDGNRVSKSKPDPQIFLKAASDLGIDPERCVVFEDSLVGIKAANAAGMKVIGVTTCHPPENLQPSNLTITDFTEVNPQKLEALFS